MKEKKQKTKKVISKPKRYLYNVIFLVALCVFLYSGYQLAHIYYQNYQESEEKKELTKIGNVPENPENEPFTINWKELKEKNKDIVGWILIPDTNISYPIVHGSDNAYYLTHSAEKKVNYAGAIFVDAFAQKGFIDKNTIIYGHNMRHKTMFTDIENFKEKEYFEKRPYVYIFTPTKNYRCEIFSLYTTKDSSESYHTVYGNDEEYKQYLTMIQDLSDFKRDINVRPQDHIISLSTCSHERNGESSELRYLLHAKMVEWKGTYMKEK